MSLCEKIQVTTVLRSALDLMSFAHHVKRNLKLTVFKGTITAKTQNPKSASSSEHVNCNM